MIKRLVCFFTFFFLFVAFYLYMVGVRQITYDNSIYWVRGIFDKFNTLNIIRVPEIPRWEFVLPADPAWYEYVWMMLSYLYNAVTGAFNIIFTAINFVGDIMKMCIAIVWMFVESWRLLIT